MIAKRRKRIEGWPRLVGNVRQKFIAATMARYGISRAKAEAAWARLFDNPLQADTQSTKQRIRARARHPAPSLIGGPPGRPGRGEICASSDLAGAMPEQLPADFPDRPNFSRHEISRSV